MAEEPTKESKSGAGTKPEGGRAAGKSSTSTPDATRRGLIKAGMIAAPVILTLKGRSAMGRETDPNISRLSGTHSQAGINQLNQDTEFKRG